MLTLAQAALTSGSHPHGQSGSMGDFLAILSFVAFIAVFLAYIWSLERV
jgi:hypothetical protein